MSTKKLIKALGLIIVVALLAVALPLQAKAQTGPTPDISWYNETDTSFTLVNADDLAGLAQLVNAGNSFEGKSILLGNDISLSTYPNWVPIGTEGKPFKGTFDGAEKKISDLSINDSTAVQVGLFGYVWPGTLKNVSIETVAINAKEAVGSLVGSMNGPIENVHVSGVTINSTHWAGGIVGYHYGNMSNCSATNTVITLTYDTSIPDNGDKAGGLIGYHGEGNSAINDCTAEKVSVTGVRDVGGLVGTAQAGNVFTNCHVIDSTVTANKATFEHSSPYAGGLIGRVAGATVTLRYSSAVDVTVTSYVDGFTGNLVGGPAANWVNLPVMLVHDGTVDFYSTIQAAADEVRAFPTPGTPTTYTINIASGTYDTDSTIDILQQENKNIVLNGEFKDTVIVKDQVRIDGNARHNAAEAVTIQNIKFDFSNLSGDIITTAKLVPGTYVYAHNITVKDCDFLGNPTLEKYGSVVAVRAASGGGHTNFVLENLTGTNIHSLLQATSVTYPGATIKNCTVTDSLSGLNLVNSPGFVDHFIYSGLETGIRTNFPLTVTNSSIVSAGSVSNPADPKTAIVTRYTDNKVITITDSLIKNSNAGNYAIANDTSSPVTSVTLVIKNVDTGGGSFDLALVGGLGPVALASTFEGTTTYKFFTTIQSAIDVASDGDTINVAAGTYAENVDVTKAVTLLGPNAGIPGNGTRVPEAVIQGTAASWVSLYVEPNVPDVTIDGFKFDGANLTPAGYAVGVAGDSSNLTVKNNIFVNHNDIAIMTSGVYWNGSAWMYDKWLTGILIKDNLITNTTPSTSIYNFGIYFQSSLGNVTGNVVTNMRNGIQVQPYWNTPDGGVVSGNKFTAYRTGIYFNYTQNEAANWEFLGNQIEGIAYPSGLDPDRFNAIRVETFSAGRVEFSHNQVLLGATNATEQYQYYESNVTGGTSIATPNWWGNWYGPSAGKIDAEDATIGPWCADIGCATFLPDAKGEIHVPAGQTLTADILQTLIDNAPEGTKIFVPAATYTRTGGYQINKPHLTIILTDGTVIQNDSPCFVINASFTKIYAQPGAKCIPVGGANGIDVAAGLTDIRVKGLEITGIDPEDTGNTSGDGIHFAGAINGVVLADNKIHNLGGDGVEFVDSPTGTVDIHGNLFASNVGLGIKNSDATSPTVVDATYNSWGSYDGPEGTGGDGVSANVDANPYTYGDFRMSSSGSPWADQVVKGQTITYTIKALVKQVNAADVTFTYPAGLTVSSFEAIETRFSDVLLNHDSDSRTISYAGLSLNGQNVDGDVDLFRVTFTASANMRDAVMNIVDGNFGMAGVESSSNVYVQGIDDGKITVIDLPTISSTDITGPYLAGVSQEFHVTTTNPATGGNFAHVLFNYRITNAVIADIAQFQYKAGDQWFNMPLEQDGLDLVGYFGPSSGFPMGPSYNATTTFRITFKTVKSYPFTLTLNDLDASSEELAKLEATAIVNGNFAITGTFTMQGNLNRGGIPVALTWTGTEWEYSASDTTEDLLVNNFQVTVTYGGGYRITTNQPRYLNLTTASNKTITVNAAKTLAPLMLRGGDVFQDGEITVGDASLIGTYYGQSISTDPDANFDGKVNIFDLALVGGNFGLTSATAYNSWTP